MTPLTLNQRGLRRCEELVNEAERHQIVVAINRLGTRLIDCGVEAAGGLEAGRAMAEICLANLGQVTLSAGYADNWGSPAVVVTTDQPTAACMASQYAGWQIVCGKYFAMGSGPMRAARGKEALFDQIGNRERADAAIGILESAQLPDEATCQQIADECQINPNQLTLLVAPTASLAGTVQVVARTVETALHKMHEIGFGISAVASGFGAAPLPPVAKSDLAAIGRTNDAVLYGGVVNLWVQSDDAVLTELGPRIPSSSSPDFGRPFSDIFDHYKRDFYKIDPLLFSPAVVRLNNMRTGRVFEFGSFSKNVLQQSFFGSSAEA